MLAAALLLAGCQGGSDDKKADTSELQQRLSAARTTIDEAETVDVSLATKSLPDGVTGLLSATGQGIANPIGAIWSGAMMLDHLGEGDAAAAILSALEQSLANDGPRTRDLGGFASTEDVTSELVSSFTSG